MMHADRHSRGRVLAITQLFPWDRHRATFNQQQFERLGQRCQLSILVAVPWTTALRRLGEYRRANREARSANSPVRYFVYFHIPGLFRSLNSLFLFLALLLQRSYSISQDHWDRLLASWAFPR